MGEIRLFSLTPTEKKCKACDKVITDILKDFCNIDCQTDWNKKYIKSEFETIKQLKEKCPQYYLTTELLFIDSLPDLLPIGIFKCVKCSKPILSSQFNWSRGFCGVCDTGHYSAKWSIEKPSRHGVEQ